MSEQKKTKQKIPDGHTQYLITRQKEPNQKGFIGYETIWESWQKVAEYSPPKQP